MEGRPEGGPCFEQEIMSLEVLRTVAAAMTIIAAAIGKLERAHHCVRVLSLYRGIHRMDRRRDN